MTDQPQAPHQPGTSGAWQPVPGGGDYDPDQTMHVSFAAQLPPEPGPGEDPLGAHGPAGSAGPAEPSGAGPAAQWTIPVIRDEAESDSGEYSVGAFSPSAWDQAPSPAAPTQSFPAGMFGQGAAAAQAAQAAQAAAQVYGGRPPAPEPAAEEHPSGQWSMPFTGPEAGEAVPWLPAHAPAADAAWSGVVDDPERPEAAVPHPDDPSAAAAHPLDAEAADTAFAPGGTETGYPGGAGPQAAYGTPDTAGTLGTPGTDGIPESHDVPAHPRPAGHPDLPGAPGGEAGPDRPDGPDEGVDRADPAGGADPAGPADGDPLLVPGDGPLLVPDGAGSDAEPDPDPDLDAGPEAESEPEPVVVTRSEHPVTSFMLRVNGADRPVTDVWLGESLLYVLRERLGLAGAKDGCEQGECGACSVQVDGRLVASCLVPAATAAGSDVRTVEGLTVEGRPSDVQRALAGCGAVQCGFCIPGMAMTVHDLLEGNHKPTDLDVRQALSGNLCRCSGYRGVLDAVRQVVTERAAADDGDTEDQIFVPHQGGPLPGGTV